MKMTPKDSRFQWNCSPRAMSTRLFTKSEVALETGTTTDRSTSPRRYTNSTEPHWFSSWGTMKLGVVRLACMSRKRDQFTEVDGKCSQQRGTMDPGTRGQRGPHPWACLQPMPSDAREQLLTKRELLSLLVQAQEKRIQAAASAAQATLQAGSLDVPSVPVPGSNVDIAEAPADPPSFEPVVHTATRAPPINLSTALDEPMPDQCTGLPHTFTSPPVFKQAVHNAYPAITNRSSQQGAAHRNSSQPPASDIQAPSHPSSANLSPSQHHQNNSAGAPLGMQATLLKGTDELEVVPATPCTQLAPSNSMRPPPTCSTGRVNQAFQAPNQQLDAPGRSGSLQSSGQHSRGSDGQDGFVCKHVISVASTPLADAALQPARTAPTALPITWVGTAFNPAVEFIPETNLQAVELPLSSQLLGFQTGSFNGSQPPNTCVPDSSGASVYQQHHSACARQQDLQQPHQLQGSQQAYEMLAEPTLLPPLPSHPPAQLTLPHSTTGRLSSPPAELQRQQAQQQVRNSQQPCCSADAGLNGDAVATGGSQADQLNGSRADEQQQQQQTAGLLQDCHHQDIQLQHSADLGRAAMDLGHAGRPAASQGGVVKLSGSASQYDVRLGAECQCPMQQDLCWIGGQPEVMPTGNSTVQGSDAQLQHEQPLVRQSGSQIVADGAMVTADGPAGAGAVQEAGAGAAGGGEVLMQGDDGDGERVEVMRQLDQGPGDEVQAQVVLLPVDHIDQKQPEVQAAQQQQQQQQMHREPHDVERVPCQQQQQQQPHAQHLPAAEVRVAPSPFPEQFLGRFPGRFQLSQAAEPEESPMPIMLAQQQPVPDGGCEVCMQEVQLPGQAWHVAASSCSCMLAVVVARGIVEGETASNEAPASSNTKGTSSGDGRWRQKKGRTSTGSQQKKQKPVLETVVFGCDISEGLQGLDWSSEPGAPLPASPAALHVITPQPLHVSVSPECDHLILGNPLVVLAVSEHVEYASSTQAAAGQLPGSPAVSAVAQSADRKRAGSISLPVLVLSTALQCPDVCSTAQQQHVRLVSWRPVLKVAPQPGGQADEVQQGSWEVVQLLEGHAPMYCVLACGDGSSIMGAGKAGQAAIWTIRCSQQQQVTPDGRVTRVTAEVCEYYRLPQAKYHGISLQDITCLSGLPSQPHMVVGTSGTGSVAVWDTMRRRCVLACHTSHTSVTPPLPIDLLTELRTRQQLRKAKETAANGHRAAGGMRFGSDDSNLGQPLPGMVGEVVLTQTAPGLRAEGVGCQLAAHTPGPTPLPRRAGMKPPGSHFPTTRTPAAGLPRGVLGPGSHPGGTLPRTEPRTLLPSGLREATRKVTGKGSGEAEGVGGAGAGGAHTPVCFTIDKVPGTADWASTGMQGGFTGGWTPFSITTSHARSALRKGVTIEWEHEILTPQNPLILLSVSSHSTETAAVDGTGGGGMQGREARQQQDGCGVQLDVFCGDKHSPAIGPSLPAPVQGAQSLGSRVLLLTQHGQVQLWDMVQGGITWAVQARQAGKGTVENGPSQAGAAQAEVVRGCKARSVALLSCECACVVYSDVLLVCGWRE